MKFTFKNEVSSPSVERVSNANVFTLLSCAVETPFTCSPNLPFKFNSRVVDCNQVSALLRESAVSLASLNAVGNLCASSTMRMVLSKPSLPVSV